VAYRSTIGGAYAFLMMRPPLIAALLALPLAIQVPAVQAQALQSQSVTNQASISPIQGKAVAASTISYVQIHVLVADESGTPLPGVTVRMISLDGTTTATSAADGSALLIIPSGKYDIQFSADGYWTDKVHLLPITDSSNFPWAMAKGDGIRELAETPPSTSSLTPSDNGGQ
jgi:hypothetical protein